LTPLYKPQHQAEERSVGFRQFRRFRARGFKLFSRGLSSLPPAMIRKTPELTILSVVLGRENFANNPICFSTNLAALRAARSRAALLNHSNLSLWEELKRR
jgi:hypothetical protein